MCVSGICTTSAAVAVSSCPFGDDLILDRINFATSASLPQVQMTCEDAWNFGATYDNNFCSDSNFKSVCCNYCKRYDTVTCTDILSCSGYSSFCNTGATLTTNGISYNINVACARTCKACDSEYSL